jgi:hypothetical protein
LRQTGFRPLFSVRWQLAPDPLHLRPPPATATAAPLRFAIHHFAFNILERFRKSRSHGWKKMEEDDFAPAQRRKKLLVGDPGASPLKPPRSPLVDFPGK